MNWTKEVCRRIEEAIFDKKKELEKSKWELKELGYQHNKGLIKTLRSEIKGLEYAWVIADLTNDDYEKGISND